MFENVIKQIFPTVGINGWRIIGNGGVGFFTAFAALTAAGVTEAPALGYAVLGAVIQGGLAAMQELKAEADAASVQPPKNTFNGKKKKRLYTLF